MGWLADAVRPRWTSASFLLYSGAVVMLVSLAVMLGSLGNDHGSGGLALWTAVVLAVLVSLALVAQRAGRDVAAGLLAFLAVGAAALLAGALFDLAGLDGSQPFDDDLDGLTTLVAVVALAAGAAGLRFFRHPLHVLAIVAAATVIVLDLTAGALGTGNWVAVAALVLGAAEITAARRLDAAGRHAVAFWLHVAGPATLGGGLVWLLDFGDVGWVLIGGLSFLYLAVARALQRSAWAVFGAIGLLLATTHFVGRDNAADLSPFSVVPAGAEGDIDIWDTALVYALLGVLYGLIGLAFRERTEH